MAYIHNLPREILQEIFSYVLIDSPGDRRTEWLNDYTDCPKPSVMAVLLPHEYDKVPTSTEYSRHRLRLTPWKYISELVLLSHHSRIGIHLYSSTVAGTIAQVCTGFRNNMVECLEVSKYIFEFPRSGSIPGLRKYVSVLNSTLTFKARDKVKHLLLSTGAQYCHPRESQTSRDSASTRPRRQRAAWDFLAGEFPAVESVTIVLDLRDHGPSQLTDDRRIETLISRIMLMASAWKDVQKIILMLRGSDPEPFALSMDMRMRKGYFHRQINEDLILQTCRSRTRTRDWLDEEQYVKIEEKLDKRLRAERKRSAKEGLQAYFEGRMDWSHEERYPMTEGKLYKRLRAERELSAERRRKSHYEGGLMTEKRRKNELR